MPHVDHDWLKRNIDAPQVRADLAAVQAEIKRYGVARFNALQARWNQAGSELSAASAGQATESDVHAECLQRGTLTESELALIGRGRALNAAVGILVRRSGS